MTEVLHGNNNPVYEKWSPGSYLYLTQRLQKIPVTDLASQVQKLDWGGVPSVGIHDVRLRLMRVASDLAQMDIEPEKRAYYIEQHHIDQAFSTLLH